MRVPPALLFLAIQNEGAPALLFLSTQNEGAPGLSLLETGDGGNHNSHYSARNARAGSIDAARRAGISPATQAANANAKIAAPITCPSALVIS